MDKPSVTIDEKGVLVMTVNLEQPGGLWLGLGASIQMADSVKAYFQERAMQSARKAQLGIIKPNGNG